MTVVCALRTNLYCRAGTCPRRGTTNCVQTRSSVLSSASQNGTPSGRALRIVERTLAVGRDDSARRVQELPVLSLRGRSAPVAIYSLFSE